LGKDILGIVITQKTLTISERIQWCSWDIETSLVHWQQANQQWTPQQWAPQLWAPHT